MTQEHIIFIPTVFFLGFFLGGIVSQRNIQYRLHNEKKETTDGEEVKESKQVTSAYTLGFSFFIFLSVFITTHILPFFGGAKALSFALNGKPLFDQRPIFSNVEFYQRMNDYGNFGREMYQRFTYSMDVIFPLSFLGFLLVLTKFAFERSSISKIIRNRLMLFPFIWFLSDMIENSILFFLLNQFPIQNEFLSSLLGFVTVAKFGLLLFSIITPITVSILYRK